MELVDLPLKDYEDDHNDWFENEFGEKERNILRQRQVNFRQFAHNLLRWSGQSESCRRNSRLDCDLGN